MRDLSILADESFDLVYGMGTCYIPDVREVFVGVARVLRTGGIYRPDFMSPAVEFVDDTDWDDEVRLFLEERASFSADALTGMEANLRFGGPETMESKIFARLTAWQNWIFQRPNAVGEQGALKRYGSGERPQFDRTRV